MQRIGVRVQYADGADRDYACKDIVELISSVEPQRARAYINRIEDSQCKRDAVDALRAAL